jgi:hypothetical protein
MNILCSQGHKNVWASLKVVTNEKGEAIGEFVTIIC